MPKRIQQVLEVSGLLRSGSTHNLQRRISDLESRLNNLPNVDPALPRHTLSSNTHMSTDYIELLDQAPVATSSLPTVPEEQPPRLPEASSTDYQDGSNSQVLNLDEESGTSRRSSILQPPPLTPSQGFTTGDSSAQCPATLASLYRAPIDLETTKADDTLGPMDSSIRLTAALYTLNSLHCDPEKSGPRSLPVCSQYMGLFESPEDPKADKPLKHFRPSFEVIARSTSYTGRHKRHKSDPAAIVVVAV